MSPKRSTATGSSGHARRSPAGSGTARTRFRDEGGQTTIEVHRREGRVTVHTDGPVRVDRVAFPAVAGTADPDEVVVNGERLAVRSVAGTWMAVRDSR